MEKLTPKMLERLEKWKKILSDSKNLKEEKAKEEKALKEKALKEQQEMYD